MAILPTTPAQAKDSAKDRLKALPQFLVGGDISLLDWEIQNGQIYKIDGKPEAPLALMKDAGWNFTRIRLWVNPTGQGIFVNDLPHTIALGKEINDAGLVLSLDLHFSDTWADPQRQTKPAAWTSLPFNQLSSTVEEYTRDVISKMNGGGAMPQIVCVGNEITNGMLWPDGKDDHDFTNLAILLKAAEKGIAEGSQGTVPPLIMIHIDRGGDWKGTKWFFDNLNAQHVTYDMIGLSYYPMYHGPMAGLDETLQNAARRYKKPIVVIETGYAYADAPQRAGFPPRPNASHDYPFTPDGQNQFTTDLIATVKNTPTGLGRGILWWEPEWIPVPGQRGGWGLTLFDRDGNALPALTTLGSAGVSR